MTYTNLELDAAILEQAMFAAESSGCSLSEYIEAALREKLAASGGRSGLYEERIQAIEQDIADAVARWRERRQAS